MLKIKALRLNAIGRFVEPQSVDFANLGNLVQIDGQNNNTGGSSGAAKSTIFNALDYLFGLNDLPTTVLQSRLTKDGIAVSADLDWDGKPVTVSRSKSKGLVIELGDETISGSKTAEEKLDEIIAMPRKLFRSILHKRQKEGGFFLDFTPQKTHEFMTDCLGLGKYRSKLEIVDKKIKDITDQITANKNALESALSALNATNSAIVGIGDPPVAEVQEGMVDQLKLRYSKSSNDLAVAEMVNRDQMLLLEKERPQVSVAPFDRSQIEVLERGKTILNNKINQLRENERARVNAVYSQIADLKIEKSRLESNIRGGNTAQAEAVSIAGEIKKIRENLCPTCEQCWANEKAKEKEASLLLKIKKLKESIEAGKQAQEQLPDVISKISALEPELQAKPIPEIEELVIKNSELELKLQSEREKERAHQVTENQKNKTLMEAFVAKQKELAAAHSAEIAQLRGQADVDRRSYEAAAFKLKSYNEAKNRYESSLVTLNKQKEKYELDASAASTLVLALEEQLALAEEAKKVIKSYMSCSFDDALELVGETATKIIRSIPNMANSTIQLEGIKETKEGKVKEEVNAVISMDGEVGIPIKSLSGGERSAVDLAVDLAVIDLIESKTNKGIDVFILDEPFTGLDTVSIEMALEVLRNANLNKKLIIVDHNPEIKQMVNNRIVVERTGSFSKVIQ